MCRLGDIVDERTGFDVMNWERERDLLSPNVRRLLRIGQLFG